MKEVIEQLLNKICLDERLAEGVFFIEDNTHMDILQEYLVSYGVTSTDSIIIRNAMLEGKYPERQAYNTDGLLVTFPTPEYKQNAIQRGTHFEENPKKAQANIFQGQQGQVAPQSTDGTQPTATPAAAPQMDIPAPETKQTEPSTPPAVPTAASDEKELTASSNSDTDNRTPEEKREDSKAVEMMLSDAPATVDISKNYPNVTNESKLFYTLKEAKNFNFYEKNGVWFDSEGEYVGKKWYCETTTQTLIIP